MAGTTVPALSGPQIARRIAADFPRGWAGDDAKASGNTYALLLSVAEQLKVVLGGIQYDAGAARLQTATSPELDLASVDFFGGNLPRPSGLSDSAFAALIIANLFQPAATRPALFNALLNLCGSPPRMIEPWSVFDTGWWRGQSYWNVDTTANPARWANATLRHQGFIETVPPQIPAVGPNNPVLTWGTAYWNAPGYFLGIISAAPERAVYDLINRIKAEGTTAWVKIKASDAPPVGVPGVPSGPQFASGPFSASFASPFGSGALAKPVVSGTPPSPVINLSVRTNQNSASLAWGAPLQGSPSFAYTAFYRVTGTASWVAGPTVAVGTAVITGLQANVQYDFEVIVRNSADQATSGAVTATTLKVPPGPATNLAAANLGSTSITLTWSLPSTGTPPFTCYAQYRVVGTTQWIPFGLAGNYTTITITGLQPATAYEFDVVTSNV